jgi:hypothetical protein
MKQHFSSSALNSAQPAESSPAQKLRPLASFLDDLGVTAITGWRWRKRGWITTITIAGRQYISEAKIAEFNRRAEAGEFETLTKDRGQE